MIPEKAVACRHCGASEESGWSQEGEQWAGSFEDEDFDYAEFLENEFPEDATHRPDPKKLVILILLLGFVFTTLFAFFR